jgi:hypothetical protein
MNMRELKRILTSKAILLTYAFVGYLAVAERELPSCGVDRVPAYSINDQTQPSAQSHPVAMAEHMGVVKKLPVDYSVEVLILDPWLVHTPAWMVLHAARPPTHSAQIFCSPIPRAPPPSIFF